MTLEKSYNAIINGTFDPYLLYNRFSKLYDNIKYYNPLNKKFIGAPNSEDVQPTDGIKIENIFNCIIHEGIENVNSKINLSMNLEIFSERCILIEIIMGIDNYNTLQIIIDKYDDIDENTLKIEEDGKIKNISFSGIIGDILMNKIMNFNNPKFSKIIEEFDPTAEEIEKGILDKVKELSSFDADIFGNFGGFSINNGFESDFIIQDLENNIQIDNNWEQIYRDCGVFKSEIYSSYLINDENKYKEFKEDYHSNLINRNIIEGYNLLSRGWYRSINNESDDLIKNLNNTNEIYWRELRLKIERWQLYFLKEDSHRSYALDRIQSLHKYKFINSSIKDTWLNDANKAKDAMYRQVDEIKYQLENIATPGHTHDEQSLQIETEKTNERILLLSFLALSIPMLNAILSPEFTNNTKIISFVILLSLPLFYFSIIQIVKIRKNRTNKKKDLLRRKEGVLRNLEANRFDLEQVIDDQEMSEDSKNNAIELLNLNINTMEKFLKRFDGKL